MFPVGISSATLNFVVVKVATIQVFFTPVQCRLRSRTIVAFFLFHPKVFTVKGAKAIFDDAVNLESGEVKALHVAKRRKTAS